MQTANRMVPLTDTRGYPLLPDLDMKQEPNPGSIVLTQGLHGTAYQRHFSDGLWHSTRGGAPRRWAEITAYRNVVLVYEADPR